MHYIINLNRILTDINLEKLTTCRYKRNTWENEKKKEYLFDETQRKKSNSVVLQWSRRRRKSWNRMQINCVYLDFCFVIAWYYLKWFIEYLYTSEFELSLAQTLIPSPPSNGAHLMMNQALIIYYLIESYLWQLLIQVKL